MPEKAPQRVAALAGIGEARRRLGLAPGQTLQAEIKAAQLLSRSVRALCNHVETLADTPQR
ncbi:DUF6415 family natural product biosynthesis protein [Streptomyces sp. NPDC002795]|uniref:DUF6415 family natural product biosynthesis protein n=1 Tax=Streptomyces sp. NPDC002795 TaxID=3364665 RepID=UPI003683D4AC